jgi:hypothetical protein
MNKPVVLVAGIFVGAILFVSGRTLIVNDTLLADRVSADADVLKSAQKVLDHEKVRQSELDQREAYVDKAENKLGLSTPAQVEAAAAKAKEKSKMMSTLITTVMKQQMDMKLATLKARLNLSPDQEKAITDIMAKQEQLAESMASKMMEGSMSKTDLEKAAKDAGANKDELNLDKQLQDILSPDQQTEYAAMQSDEKKNQAETMANMEFTTMQSSLQLSEDQKDPVFNALMALRQNPPKGDFAAQAEAKKAALQPLLTPAQFDTYSKSVDAQTQMVKEMTKGLPDGTTVTTDASVAP